MYLVHHQGIARQDVAVLKPAARDTGGDDDDVPRRRLGRRLPLAIDDANLEFGAENRLGDRGDRQRLSGSGAGYDSKTLAGGGELPDLVAVLLLKDC